jgi:pimeloyl-ACP methyl ester carboxylesterase
MTYSTQTLDIAGYRDEPVPNTLYRQERETQHLAILLPGMSYTCQAPLLFYPARLLGISGADVFFVEYAYNWRPDFLSLPEDERERWLFTDVTAACRAALAQRSYRQVTLVGKSLGTLAMGHLLTCEASLSRARAIWLTPLLPIERLRGEIRRWGGPSLFVIGTADTCYDPDLLREVQSATKGETVVIEGADHILETSDIWESLRILEQVMRAVQQFLDEDGKSR